MDNTKGDWWRDRLDMNNTWVVGEEPRKSKFQVYFPSAQTLMVTSIEQESSESPDPYRSLCTAWYERL